MRAIAPGRGKIGVLVGLESDADADKLADAALRRAAEGVRLYTVGRR